MALTEIEGGTPVARQYWLSRPADLRPGSAPTSWSMVLGSPASSVDSRSPQVGLQTGSALGAYDEIFVYPIARVRDLAAGARWRRGSSGRARREAGGRPGRPALHRRRDRATSTLASASTPSASSPSASAGAPTSPTRWPACVGRACARSPAPPTTARSRCREPDRLLHGTAATWTMQGKGDTQLGLAKGRTTLDYWLNRHGCSNDTQSLAVVGPNGSEDCVSYAGCSMPDTLVRLRCVVRQLGAELSRTRGARLLPRLLTAASAPRLQRAQPRGFGALHVDLGALGVGLHPHLGDVQPSDLVLGRTRRPMPLLIAYQASQRGHEREGADGHAPPPAARPAARSRPREAGRRSARPA